MEGNREAMYGRTGLDRFKKAQTLEPFSVTLNSAPKPATQPASEALIHPSAESPQQTQHHVSQNPLVADVPTQLVSQLGGGQSTWKPPDWAIEPRPGVYYLEVLKDGEVLDQINLDKRRHIFGRQFHTCDFVLDHQSVSRQHAAVVPHKNGRYDLCFILYLFIHLYFLKFLWVSFNVINLYTCCSEKVYAF